MVVTRTRPLLLFLFRRVQKGACLWISVVVPLVEQLDICVCSTLYSLLYS